MTALSALPGLDPDRYQRHGLHAEGCIWVEKNCYVDLWIEVLHGLTLEPVAMMPFTLAVDFEGDQWTFYKPSHDELRLLYGVDTQELNIWRPLLSHVIEHVGSGKLVSTEADAYWLPDTAGTDYRRKHSKTTIVITSIDTDARRIEYFHNAGLFRLEGDDYVGLFQPDTKPSPDFLPLFAEVIRLDRIRRRSGPELAALTVDLLRRHVERIPSTNPVERFRDRFDRDLPELIRNGLDNYHAWAFGTIRQMGSAYELSAACLEWLGEHYPHRFAGAANAFRRIALANKTLILKAARSVNSGKPMDGRSLFDEMQASWTEAMELTRTATRPG